MSFNVGVLCHYQPLDSKPSTHLPKDVARELVRRMIAERISHKVIRMFEPGTFNALKGRAVRYPGMSASSFQSMQAPTLFGGEIGGVKFKLDRKRPENELIAKVRRIPAADVRQAIAAE